MTSLRLDNILIVVEDLGAAIEFFEALGMAVEGRQTVEGPSVDRLINLEGTRAKIVSLVTPDGHVSIELDKLHWPAVVTPRPHPAPVNTLGYRRVMSAVDDLDVVLDRLHAVGAELVDQVVDYQDVYRLCYVRGPEGILVGIAQQLG